MEPIGIRPEDCELDVFRQQCERELSRSEVPRAAAIDSNIPLYDASALTLDRGLLLEWARVLRHSAGVLVLRQGCPDHEAIDRATAVYEAIVIEERTAGVGAGDHFVAAGANDRIWNSLQKLAFAAPDIFARYFASPAIDAVARAWLGPAYQMTAQVNIVRPGGKAQRAHRDYHLGFQTPESSACYPAQVHECSPLLTLQGGIAHVDMPLESGPTKLLPFSQTYREGYQAYHLPAFAEYFEAHQVQLPLQKGDAVFFNPALFHAAGENRSADIQRFVNLLQISSAMGRAMEAVDRVAMCKAIYPALLRLTLGEAEQAAVIAACAEGYSFPTNLDRDPPLDGMAPRTQADILRAGLAERKSPGVVAAEIDALAHRQQP